MADIVNNLYPPIVDTYMPAFIGDTENANGIVYFSLSAYNSPKDIGVVQVSVTHQNTNLSALDPKQYPAGIKFTQMIPVTRNGVSQYYISILGTDLKEKKFGINQYYKVQIRFTKKNNTAGGIISAPVISSGDDQKAIAKKHSQWLINNQLAFSEWSTVCLLKGISTPILYLKGFENNGEDETIFSTEVVELVGNLSFKDINEKEYLKSYHIKIYEIGEFGETLICDSGDVYVNPHNPNEINYTLKTNLDDGIFYRLEFTYTTINEYTQTFSYKFLVVKYVIDSLNAKITATPEEELGRMKINVVSTISEIFFGHLIIRRTSSRSDFTVWEDIHKVTIADGEMLDYTWYDYTMESGVWYKYCAQKITSSGYRSPIVIVRHPVMAVFDDMFLTRKDMQLRVRFDPEISSFKNTMIESKTETLGSKYPIIRRNGDVNYKEFSISGLITAFCDEEGIFLSKKSIYGKVKDNYENYNDQNDIDEYQDYIYEREFRQKVMEFLEADNIKLFRSTTEGNFLVRLMDVSYTPNQTLGRMLYSFSATAYEIDECSIYNYDRYGIQSLDEFYRGGAGTTLSRSFDILGQWQGVCPANTEVVLSPNGQSILSEKYSNTEAAEFIRKLQYLKWARLEFNMAPYLIKNDGSGKAVPIPKPAAGSAVGVNENTALGYLVNINGRPPTVVSSRGFYEISGNGVNITSLTFPVAADITLDYVARMIEEENPKFVFDKETFYTRVGQIVDIFPQKENVCTKIYNKYFRDFAGGCQRLLAIDKISIETIPGAIVYIQDSTDLSDENNYFRHEIGPTGVLQFYDNDPNSDADTIVLNFYFDGIKLYPTKGDVDENRDRNFTKVDGTFSSRLSITNPIKNGVYNIGGQDYIYYHNQWYEFSEDNVVQCPVEALIDYIYELEVGLYKAEEA